MKRYGKLSWKMIKVAFRQILRNKNSHIEINDDEEFDKIAKLAYCKSTKN